MPSSKIELLIQKTNLCDYNKINLSIDYIDAGHINVVVVKVITNQSMFPARKFLFLGLAHMIMLL